MNRPNRISKTLVHRDAAGLVTAGSPQSTAGTGAGRCRATPETPSNGVESANGLTALGQRVRREALRRALVEMARRHADGRLSRGDGAGDAR